MGAADFQSKLSELGKEFDVPGVAAAILHEGDELYAFHGVTSVDNPLEVDAETMFQFGSTGKTYTATAMMRLVDRGDVALDAPVRKYIPELKLKDEGVAEAVTILQLFNHTAGWSGDLMEDTGDGDDSLDKYVALMADIDQVEPLGKSVSYNNASLSLAGLVIARTVGKTYEAAMRELLFEPMGLEHSFFFPNEIMTRRFAVGHQRSADGTIKVARPWSLPRGNFPAGGISSNAADQLAWAKFHLGDGTIGDGTRILSKELLDLMKEPTASMPGSALGDHVGISWLLRDVGDVRLCGHGGTTNGQHSEFLMVPEKGFAIISMTNCGPNGPQLNKALEQWALQEFLGISDTESEPVLLGDEALMQYTGQFETIAAIVNIEARQGRLSATVKMKPEFAAQLREAGEDLPEDESPAIILGMLEGDGDRYVVAEGDAKGMKGYFARNDSGDIDGVHLGGRLATRPAAAGVS